MHVAQETCGSDQRDADDNKTDVQCANESAMGDKEAECEAIVGAMAENDTVSAKNATCGEDATCDEDRKDEKEVEKCVSPREALLQLASNPRLHIRQDVPFSDALSGSGRSNFCFIPRGKSGWSSRLFRIMFAGCLPVLLNDYYEIPFSEFLNIQDWMIKWPMKNINADHLLSVLENVVDSSTFLVMLSGLERDRCWYVYPPSLSDAFYHADVLDALCPHWKTQNAFLAIVRLLARKVRVSKNSPNTFFFPFKDSLLYVNETFDLME